MEDDEAVNEFARQLANELEAAQLFHSVHEQLMKAVDAGDGVVFTPEETSILVKGMKGMALLLDDMARQVLAMQRLLIEKRG